MGVTYEDLQGQAEKPEEEDCLVGKGQGRCAVKDGVGKLTGDPGHGKAKGVFNNH